VKEKKGNRKKKFLSPPLSNILRSGTSADGKGSTRLWEEFFFFSLSFFPSLLLPFPGTYRIYWVSAGKKL